MQFYRNLSLCNNTLTISSFTIFNFYGNNEEKIKKILQYATGTAGGFGGIYPAGYHCISLKTEFLKGQRDPALRLAPVPYDFNNKTVLDLGTNTGGMLFNLASKIKLGIGIDINNRAINAANLLKDYYKIDNLHFYTFDLQKENFDIWKNFLPDKMDICFVLSMAAWITNWKNIIKQASTICKDMLYEAHGPENAQNQQISYLKTIYKKVTLISKKSDDDPSNKDRALYLCLK